LLCMLPPSPLAAPDWPEVNIFIACMAAALRAGACQRGLKFGTGMLKSAPGTPSRDGVASQFARNSSYRASRELVLHHTLSAEHEHEHEHHDRLNDEGVKHFD
jgi:hypothetical protein